MELEQKPRNPRALVAQLLDMLGNLQTRMTDHMVNEEETVAQLRASIAALNGKVDQFMAAFPGGDSRAHCEYHQLLIDIARAKNESWQKIRYDLVRYGLFGALVWAGYVLWKAFLLGPK